MPHGGFGNLIALPLQKGPRKQDNSVFLDDHLVPWADQWAYLASVRRISREQAEGIVQDAERRGRILGVRLPPQDDGEEEPWTAPPSRPPVGGSDGGAAQFRETRSRLERCEGTTIRRRLRARGHCR